MSRCRALRRLSVLVALGLLSTQATAQAKTHRFEPSHEVTVTLKLNKSTATGTLLRFARNRLTLNRRRPGVLELRAAGSRAHRLATRRRSQRVRIVLSAGNGTAKLAVGGRAATVAGRFVAEDAIVVRSGRAVSALKIRSVDPPAGVGGPPGVQGGLIAPAAPTLGAGLTLPTSPTAVPSPTTAPAPGPTSTPSPAPTPMPSPAPTSTPSPAPTPMPSPAPTPMPSPAPTPVAGPLFAPDSVWNAPLPSDAPLDPDGPALVQKLRDEAAEDLAERTGPWIATKTSSPLYIVPADQPTTRVALHSGAWATSLQTALDAVPIPPDALPAEGPDAHMTIWQPSTNKLWELWRAQRLDDGWHAEFGGAMNSVSTSVGHYSAESWPGLSTRFWGATATSLPVIAGAMRIDELRSGVIPHALALNVPVARADVFAWPAQRTDGTSLDPQAIPEGAHFRIDPELDLSKISMPSMTRMMAVAAQRYGIIVRDKTSQGLAFFGEDWRQYGVDPYYGESGFFAGKYPTALMRTFPWQHLQLLEMDLRAS